MFDCITMKFREEGISLTNVIKVKFNIVLSVATWPCFIVSHDKFQINWNDVQITWDKLCETVMYYVYNVFFMYYFCSLFQG